MRFREEVLNIINVQGSRAASVTKQQVAVAVERIDLPPKAGGTQRNKSRRNSLLDEVQSTAGDTKKVSPVMFAIRDQWP